MDEIKKYLEWRKDDYEIYAGKKKYRQIYAKLLAEKNLKERCKFLPEFQKIIDKDGGCDKFNKINAIRYIFCCPYNIGIEYKNGKDEYFDYEGNFEITIEEVIELVKNKKDVKKIVVMAACEYFSLPEKILEIDFEQ